MDTPTQPTEELTTVIANPKVRRIIEAEEDTEHTAPFVQVNIDIETYKLIANFRTKMKYTTGADSQGRGVRVFKFPDCTVYVRFEKAENKEERGKHILIMSREEAQKHLMTIEQEREGQEKFSFSL